MARPLPYPWTSGVFGVFLDPSRPQTSSSRPSNSQSTSSQLPEPQPAGSQPPVSQPTSSQIPGSQPGGAQSPASQPTSTQLPGSQPADGQPVGGQPPASQTPDPQTPVAESPGAQPPVSQPPGAEPPVSQIPDPQPPVSGPASSQSSDPQAPDNPLPATRFAGPQFTGSGTLLKDECATAQYTFIDYGPTVSYAPFIGCMSDRPECCPFTPATTTQGVSATSTGAYPQPKNAKDAIVNKCPVDYYSIRGSCCPSAFTPFTTALGGVTPCYSTLPASTTTTSPATKVLEPRATKPTVTVTGTIFALQYAVLDDGRPLSAGGIAGVLVGWSIFAGMLGWAFRLERRRRRRNAKIQRLKEELHSAFEVGTSVVPTARPVAAGAVVAASDRPSLGATHVHLYGGGQPRAFRGPAWAADLPSSGSASVSASASASMPDLLAGVNRGPQGRRRPNYPRPRPMVPSSPQQSFRTPLWEQMALRDEVRRAAWAGPLRTAAANAAATATPAILEEPLLPQFPQSPEPLSSSSLERRRGPIMGRSRAAYRLQWDEGPAGGSGSDKSVFWK